MADIVLTLKLKDELLPLLDALKGKHTLEEFLSGATELGLMELIADAARISTDQQVSNLRQVVHVMEDPIIWQAFKSLLSMRAALPPKVIEQPED
jgi:hypothetical protein